MGLHVLGGSRSLEKDARSRVGAPLALLQYGQLLPCRWVSAGFWWRHGRSPSLSSSCQLLSRSVLLQHSVMDKKSFPGGDFFSFCYYCCCGHLQ